MAQVSRVTAKTYFETGDVPTQTEFANTLDSVTWYDEGVADGDKGDVVVSGTGTVWTLEDVFKRNPRHNVFAALGSAMKAETPWSLELMSTSTSLFGGQLRVVPVWLPKDATITGVKYFLNIVGSYTPSNYNGIGLYSYSAGTLTLVASTTDDGTLWSSGFATTWQTKPFSATYSATAGLYFVGYLYNRSAQTTAPQIGVCTPGVSALNVIYFDFTNSARLLMGVSSQNTLPSSIAASSLTDNTTTFYYASIY
jgi:hypothetical protein